MVDRAIVVTLLYHTRHETITRALDLKFKFRSTRVLLVNDCQGLKWSRVVLVKTPPPPLVFSRKTNQGLLEEIKEINRELIDTVVNISEEDVDPARASEGGDGTIVKCSFSAMALGPNLKSQYASAQMSPIQSIRLLVPANYPNCSPILLDMFPADVRSEVFFKARYDCLFSGYSATPKANLSDEEITALTKRTQDGGTEV